MSDDLRDERDIIETINDVFVGTDQRDWALVTSRLAPQVVLDMTSLAGGEPATLTAQQVADGWKNGLAPIEAVHHQTGNFRVHVRGAEADAFCYGVAYHYKPTASGRNTRVFVGSYDIHLRREGAGWKIDRFRFNKKFVDGNLELEKG